MMAGCTGFAVLWLALAGLVQAQSAPRSEVPIHQRVLKHGERRYSIPIKVGATQIEAGLDTGSTGLRILPGTLSAQDAVASDAQDSYGYGAGTYFDGVIATGMLSIGGLSASATMQLIQKVGCRRIKPHCPASRLAPSQFAIMGSGEVGQGFRAIIGIGMAQTQAGNPLSAIGAKRWIVELPRRGEEGRLILNPSDDEVKGFVLLPLAAVYGRQDGLHDAVDGCILNDATKEKACGCLLMDTGAPGIQVINGTLGDNAWPSGTAALLAFYGSNRDLAAIENFTVDTYAHASHLFFKNKQPTRDTAIRAGLSPYLAFDVLYDLGKDVVGLKPRPAAGNAPQGQLVAAPAK
jgi:hypothetical protein